MASTSLGLDRGADQSPDKINVGTLAVSTYAVELRVDKTKNLTSEDVILILQAFQRYYEDERFNPLNNI